MENPSCIWGRVFWGPGGDAETTEQYSHLTAQMNLFYCNLTQDLRKLKPTTLEEGQVRPETHLRQAGKFGGGGLDVCVSFLAGVCGVLVSDEAVVSGSG